MDSNQFANFINQTDYRPQEKTALITALNQLGLRSRNFFADRINSSDFSLEKDDLYKAFSAAGAAVKSLQTDDQKPFLLLLHDASNNAGLSFGEYLLPIVLDVQTMIDKGAISMRPELLGAMQAFELDQIMALPDNEIRRVLSRSIGYFLKKVDFVRELKRRFVLDDGSTIDNWAKDYLQALENNEEVIGSQSISVDGQALPPFVKNWIKDYVATVSATPTGRGSLAEAQYFSKSANAFKLTIEDKRVLQEVLQLYDWLWSPSGSVQELEAYESATSNQSIVNQQPRATVAPPRVASPKIELTKGVTPKVEPPKATPQVETRKIQPAPLPPPPPPPLPPKSVSRPVATPLPKQAAFPVSIQDILLDRRRLSQQIYPASQRPQQSSPAPQTQVRPASPSAPGDAAKSQTSPDVEAKLAALRKKMQNNQ